jgi:hypothetical protein
MRVKFISNLGSIDAAAVKLDFRQCCAGAEVDIHDAAYEALKRKYPGLFEDIKTVAAPAAVKAVGPAHGTVEKATEDLKAYKDRQVGK